MPFSALLAALDIQTLIVIAGIVFSLAVGVGHVISKIAAFIRNFTGGAGGIPPHLTGATPTATGNSWAEDLAKLLEQRDPSQLPPLPEAEPVFAPPKLSAACHLPPVPEITKPKPAKPGASASSHGSALRVHLPETVASDVATVVGMLRNPITARQAVIASVILGRPVSDTD